MIRITIAIITALWAIIPRKDNSKESKLILIPLSHIHFQIIMLRFNPTKYNLGY